MEAERTITLKARHQPTSKQVLISAELGNLLLGDIIEFVAMNGDSAAAVSITVLDHFWLLTKSGKGGFLGIGGGNGRKATQSLSFHWDDPNLKQKDLQVLVAEKGEVFLQSVAGTKLQIRDSGRISLNIIASYTEPPPTPPGKDGYDGIRQNEDFGSYAEPPDAPLRMKITRED